MVLASEVLYDCREAQDVAVAALRLTGGGQACRARRARTLLVAAGEVLEISGCHVFTVGKMAMAIGCYDDTMMIL